MYFNINEYYVGYSSKSKVMKIDMSLDNGFNLSVRTGELNNDSDFVTVILTKNGETYLCDAYPIKSDFGKEISRHIEDE